MLNMPSDKAYKNLRNLINEVRSRTLMELMRFYVLKTMQEEEIWKDVPEYEGYYQVSNLGRVKSIQRLVKCGKNEKYLVKEKLRKEVNIKGYCRVVFHKNGIKQNMPVHRIVANAFIENNEKKPFVNHKDGVKTNNFISNLEWVTAS